MAAEVALQTSAKVSDLEFFIDRYPCLIPVNATKDMLIEQFTDYQSSDISDCAKDTNRMDETWLAIGNVNTDGCLPFKELGIAMCHILTIPHSSAHCERVFSCVRKNRTEQRSCLGDDTLESLLVLKSATGGLNVEKICQMLILTILKGRITDP